jgi:predicted MFS family arabinose efflux permease
MGMASGSARSMSLTVYAVSMISMAAVGVLIPLLPHLSAKTGAPVSTLSFAIAMFSLPSALCAVGIAGMVARFGARRVFLFASGFGVLGDLVIYVATSFPLLALGVLLAGVAFAFIVVAAPAYLMSNLEGDERTHAMALWSTYAPIGFAAGLLIAAPLLGFDGGAAAILVHAGLLAASLLASLVLLPPETAQSRSAAAASSGGMRGILKVLTDVRVLMLAVAVTIPSLISYGTSMIAPSYLTKVYGVSLAASATTVAVAKIAALLIGGLSTGLMLVRNVNPKILFGVLAGVGLVSQLVLYWPQSGFFVAAGAMIVWLFCYSGMAAVCYALLPTLTRNSAAGSGITNQINSMGSFTAAPIYFAIPSWPGFVLAAAVGLLISLLAVPRSEPQAGEEPQTARAGAAG